MAVPALGIVWYPNVGSRVPTVISYSFAEQQLQSVFITSYDAYPALVPLNTVQSQLFDKALTVWEQAANIDFVRFPDSPSINVRIGLAPIDGQGGTLAETVLWSNGQQIAHGVIVFDPVDMLRADLTLSTPPSLISFYQVSLHEVGHLLGLGHATAPTDLMYRYANGTVTLSSDDVTAVTALYGPVYQVSSHTLAALAPSVTTEILQLVQAMFSASPGVMYFNECAAVIQQGASILQLADLLSTSVAFRQYYPEFLTNRQFVERFIENLVGSSAMAADKIEVSDFLVSQIEHNWSRGEAIWWSAAALAAVSDTNIQWNTASRQFNNKLTVSEYYTVTQEMSSENLTMLQGVTAMVTSDAITVQAAIARIDSQMQFGTGQKIASAVQGGESGSSIDFPEMITLAGTPLMVYDDILY